MENELVTNIFSCSHVFKSILSLESLKMALVGVRYSTVFMFKARFQPYTTSYQGQQELRRAAYICLHAFVIEMG